MQYGKVEICGVNTSRLKLLKESEKRELLNIIKNGTKSEKKIARDKMINGNLRLVLSVIQRFTNRGENPDDLFQVGVIGLIKAIDNFDPSLDVRFSTYGVPMIIGEIRRYLRDNNSVRVSRSMRDTAYRAMQIKEQLTNKYNREPTVEEIAKIIDVPKETVVIAWESKYHLAPDLLAAGFKIINASWKPLYIVPHISKKWNALDIMRWNVHRFENWWDESDAYLNPITIAPTDKLLGAQLSVWEGNFELSVSYVLENLPALAERSWNLNRRSDDAVFGDKHHCQMLIAGRLIGE